MSVSKKTIVLSILAVAVTVFLPEIAAAAPAGEGAVSDSGLGNWMDDLTAMVGDIDTKALAFYKPFGAAAAVGAGATFIIRRVTRV